MNSTTRQFTVTAVETITVVHTVQMALTDEEAQNLDPVAVSDAIGNDDTVHSHTRSSTLTVESVTVVPAVQGKEQL